MQTNFAIERTVNVGIIVILHAHEQFCLRVHIESHFAQKDEQEESLTSEEGSSYRGIQLCWWLLVSGLQYMYSIGPTPLRIVSAK